MVTKTVPIPKMRPKDVRHLQRQRSDAERKAHRAIKQAVAAAEQELAAELLRLQREKHGNW